MTVPPGSGAAARIALARKEARNRRQFHRDRVTYAENKLAELGQMKPGDVVVGAAGIAIANALMFVGEAILEAGR